jgi:hypothetical protein
VESRVGTSPNFNPLILVSASVTKRLEGVERMSGGVVGLAEKL